MIANSDRSTRGYERGHRLRRWRTASTEQHCVERAWHDDHISEQARRVASIIAKRRQIHITGSHAVLRFS